MERSKLNLEILYYRITDLWKEFCELHNSLFDLTCDEYSLLLKSDLENLETKVEEKKAIIHKISLIESERVLLIEDLNKELSDEKKISTVSELITYFREFEEKNNLKHLFRFNALLIDIIEKIQDQNKRNQIFINKAIHALKEIRHEAVGQKNYATYNSLGKQTSKAL